MLGATLPVEAISNSSAQISLSQEVMQETSIEREISIVASITSVLKRLGVPTDEAREHLYDLLSEWIRSNMHYIYIEDLLPYCSMKEKEIDDLVELLGEDGLEALLTVLSTGQCREEDEIELLRELMEYLGVNEKAKEVITNKALEHGCKGLRTAAIALLATKPGG